MSRSETAGGQGIGAGVGDELAPVLMVHQGQGWTLGGVLRGESGGISGASVCIFSRVVTDP